MGVNGFQGVSYLNLLHEPIVGVAIEVIEISNKIWYLNC